MSPDLERKAPHRLFAAIVLMGSGLGAGCGGVAESHAPSGTSSGGSSLGGIASGGVAGAATASAGGSPSASAGGGSPSASAGDGSPSASAGAGGDAGYKPLGNPKTPPFPPAQPYSCVWQQVTCGGDAPSCAFEGLQIPPSCKCDPARPKSASDCGPGQAFVCRSGRFAASSEKVAFDCVCTPLGADCVSDCAAAFGRQYYFDCESADTGATCGCAVIYLK